MRLPEGSWGENGNHSVWINDRNPLDLGDRVPRRGPDAQAAARAAVAGRTRRSARCWSAPAASCCCSRRATGRSSSTSKGAVDYGIQRFSGHCTRFDRMTHDRREAGRGRRPLDEIERVQVAGGRPARQRVPRDRLELVDALERLIPDAAPAPRHPRFQPVPPLPGATAAGRTATTTPCCWRPTSGGAFAPFCVEVQVDAGACVTTERVLPYRDGRCQFLGDDDRCTIYEDRPANCRRFECCAGVSPAGQRREPAQFVSAPEPGRAGNAGGIVKVPRHAGGDD